MLGFLVSLFIYSVAMTIAVVCVTIDKDKYYKKYRALEDELRRLKSQQPAPTPVEQPQVQTQPQEPKPVFAQTPAAPAASAPAPTAAPVQPLPEYSRAVPQKTSKSNGLTAVGVSFSVGVLLMVIAAAVFISATWQTMPAVFKCIVLLIVVSGVYGLSTLCRKKLKLDKTSSVLYMLGSLITPLAIFVGFLAFEINEPLITLVCCGLSLGVTGLIGYKVFGSKLQVAISYLGFVWSEIFICMQIMGNVKGMGFGMCAAAFISGLIYFIKPKLKFFDWFAEITAYVAVIGLIMTTAFGKNSVAYGLVAQTLYWVSLLMLTRRRKWVAYISALVPVFTAVVLKVSCIESRTVYSVVMFCLIAVLLAVYKFIKHDNISSNAILSVGMSLVFIIVEASTGYREGYIRVEDFMFNVRYLVPLIFCGAVLVMSKIKFERAMYTYLVFASAVLLGDTLLTDGIINISIFMVVAIAAVLINYKHKMLHTLIAASVSSVIVFLMNLSGGDKDLITIVYASVATALYAVVVLINKFKTVDKTAHVNARFCVLPMISISNLVLLIRFIDDSQPALIALIVIDVIFTVLTLLDTDNYFGCVPAITFMIAVMVKLVQLEVDSTLVSLIFIFAYSLIGRFLVCRRVISKGRIDWFTMLAGFACFVPVLDLTYTLLFLTFFIMMFTGRFGKEEDTLMQKLAYKFRLISSCAIGTLALSLVSVDMEYSSVIDTEIRLMIMLIAALLVYLLVLPGKATKWIWFSTVALCIQIEAFHAMGEQLLVPLTLISVCAVGIFIYSFFFKKRSWFILAISTIGEFALLFALVFWDSRLWWIYLLILGGILIATASSNEYKRRKAIESGMADKKVRLFDDWTW